MNKHQGTFQGYIQLIRDTFYFVIDMWFSLVLRGLEIQFMVYHLIELFYIINRISVF